MSCPPKKSSVEKSPHLSELKREYESLVGWLFDKALPLWAHRGVDIENGGFHEKIAQDGRIIDEPRRTRLVARQIFAFATAAELGWPDVTRARDLVNSGLGFLLDKCRSDAGTVYATVSADGVPLRREFDLYDHAFALFALGNAARLGYRRDEVVIAANCILKAMTASWRHPIGGFGEANPPREPLNANPHMHLLEAFLAWEDAGAVDSWKDLADEIAELALGSLIDPNTGGIREHYNLNWGPVRGDTGRFLEPGHQFEWAWLLWRWAKARRRNDVITQIRRLVAVGEQHGINEATGLAVNGIWDDLTLRDADSRLWPQTERIKAHIAIAELTSGSSHAQAIALAIQASRGLTRYFETELAGLWHETIDLEGCPVPAPARASSLYHIVGAIRELDRFINRYRTDG